MSNPESVSIVAGARTDRRSHAVWLWMPAACLWLSFALPAGARAAQVEIPGALSDELKITSSAGVTLFDAKVYDAVGSIEPILAYASGTGDYSGTMGRYLSNAGSAGLWLTRAATSMHALYLTEPGQPGSVSDVLLSFRDVVGGRTTNVVAMISDPREVSLLTGAFKLFSIKPPAIAETGSFQNVTASLYPTGRPFEVNVLSSVLAAVPEPSTTTSLVAGLLALGGIAARRRILR